MGLSRLVALSLITTLHGVGFAQTPPTPAPTPICPSVELVFCLDTTGSMSGLIEGAKARIWGIINGVARALQGPRIRVGLVAYRDRGDAYITDIHGLSDNLDAVQAKLATFSAGGGGDGPESVNQALADAVGKIQWSPLGSRVYRAVFLVGDAPPHMDYTDDVKYPLTCGKARMGGLVINAIQCGTDAACAAEWTRIATLTGGGFTAIPQSGGMRVMSTPYDAWLTEFSAKLMDTAVYTGPAERRNRLRSQQEAALAQSAQALRLKNASQLAQEADRGEFRGKSGEYGGLGLGEDSAQADLIDAYRRKGAVVLQNLNPTDLPEAWRNLSAQELEARVRGKAEEREGLIRQIQDLADLRETDLESQRKRSPEKAFDEEVLNLIRRQAAALCR